jgi:hypothetical protein
VLSVVTTDNVTPEGEKREVFLPGWDRVYVWDGIDGAEPLSVRLDAGDRVVIVEGHGYSADELVAIAGEITPRSTGTAGWDVTGLPPSTVLYGEGWSSEAGHTVMSWTEGQHPLGQLTVDTRSPRLAIGDVWSVADVNGTMAIASQEPGGHSTVYWQPSPGLYAAFDMIGSIEETVQTAQQFHEASRDAWRQYAAEHALP